MRNRLFAAVVAAPSALMIAAFAAVAPAEAGSVNTMAGIGGAYNVYTIGDMGGPGAGYSSDSEADIAVGGNAYLLGFGAYSDALVGGNLSVQNGQVYGDATAGGSISLTSAAVLGAASGNTAASPFGGMSFAEVSADLIQASAEIGGLQATGTTFRNPYGQLSLTGAAAGLNVFNVSAAEITGINNFQINAPTGSTVLVNVAGDDLTFSNFGFSLSGIDASNILFNFGEATSLTFAGMGWQGSILAPLATVDAMWGNFDGSVMVGALTGIPYQNAEFHDRLFAGDLGSIQVAPVPVPAALPLFGVALAALAGHRQLKRRRKASGASAVAAAA